MCGPILPLAATTLAATGATKAVQYASQALKPSISLPTPPAIETTDPNAARARERDRRRRAQGQGSTILTGPAGARAASQGPKTLLGQ